MAIQSGRFAALKMSSAVGSQPKVVPFLGSWDLNIAIDNAEANIFGDVWKTQIPLMQGWTASVTGFMDVTTASTFTDQNFIVNQTFEGAIIQDIRFHVGPTSSGIFFVPNYGSTFGGTCYNTEYGAYVTGIKWGASKDGLDSISFDLIGRGALIMVAGGTSGYTVIAESTINQSTGAAT